MTHTVTTFERDGCLCINTLPLIRAAVFAAKSRNKSASGRATARFTVKIDGEKFTCEREDKLASILSSVAGGSKCRIFRNAGWGATLDFDI